MYAKLPSASRKRPLADFSHLLNLTDPAERFMAGWVTRLHTHRPRLYRALDVKRVERKMEGRVERLLYEVAHYAGKPASYVVITWNIDETSMCWQDFCKRSEALALYQELGSDG